MSSVSNGLAQKWSFVPEDLWDDYELMLESKNPLSIATFWKKVAENCIGVIIGCDIDEYQRKILDASNVINECADWLTGMSRSQVREGAGGILQNAASSLDIVLSAARTMALATSMATSGVPAASGGEPSFSSVIVMQKWSKQEIQTVKHAVKPLFSATMCLQGFLSRYIEKLKAVGKYIETEEGKGIVKEASGIYQKAVEGGVVAWNEDKMGNSIVTSTRHVEQAKQIKALVEYVGASGAIFASKSLVAAGTTNAKVLSRSLAGFGVAFGIWNAVSDIKDTNVESKLASEFRQASKTLKEESDKLIELYCELFLRSQPTADLESFHETL